MQGPNPTRTLLANDPALSELLDVPWISSPCDCEFREFASRVNTSTTRGNKPCYNGAAGVVWRSVWSVTTLGKPCRLQQVDTAKHSVYISLSAGIMANCV